MREAMLWSFQHQLIWKKALKGSFFFFKKNTIKQNKQTNKNLANY